MDAEHGDLNCVMVESDVAVISPRAATGTELQCRGLAGTCAVAAH